MEKPDTNPLTESNASGTLVQPMEASVKKLMKRLEEIEREEWKLSRERHSIQTALTVIGVALRKDGQAHLPSSKEQWYRANQPFKKSSLTDACMTVIRDHHKDWLNKNQVEYLVARGGYDFKTGDTKNSVHVTLRRLADEGKIRATRVRGSQGNTYRYVGESNNDLNSGTTK
jgi:hypothetical protein